MDHQYGLAQVCCVVIIVVVSRWVMSLLRKAKVPHEYSPPRSPVPRRRAKYDEELDTLSPHGTKHHSLGLPDDFQPTGDCHDSRVVGGRKLFKTVQPTQWSREWAWQGSVSRTFPFQNSHGSDGKTGASGRCQLVATRPLCLLAV